MPQMPLLVAINGCIVQILASVTLTLSVSVTLDISVSHPTPDHVSNVTDDMQHHHYLDLGDHVAGDKARSGAGLAPVEAISVLLPDNLKQSSQYFLSASISGLTLISWPSLKGSSSSQASGLGDMVGGS